MNEALIAAQQLRADSKAQADKEAEGIIREARGQAMLVISAAQQDEQGVRERYESAQRQFAAYISNFRALLERQLAEIDGLQAHSQTMSQMQTEMVLKRQA